MSRPCANCDLGDEFSVCTCTDPETPAEAYQRGADDARKAIVAKLRDLALHIYMANLAEDEGDAKRLYNVAGYIERKEDNGP